MQIFNGTITFLKYLNIVIYIRFDSPPNGVNLGSVDLKLRSWVSSQFFQKDEIKKKKKAWWEERSAFLFHILHEF